MSQTILTLSMVFLIPIFVSKSYDVFYDVNYKIGTKDENLLNTIQFYRENKPNIMLLASCILIVLGILLSGNVCNVTTYSIGWAGFLLLAYTLLTNWYQYSPKYQLAILGLCIVVFGAIGSNAVTMQKILYC